METGVIYIIRCKINQKLYIGSASCWHKRRGAHIACLRRNKHKNPHLQRSWNKYGEENFEFEIIQHCNINQLIEREQYYIDALRVCNDKYGFNMNPIAGTTLGRKMSVSAKKKIGDFWRGKPKSKQAKINMQRSREKDQGKPVITMCKKTGKILKEYPSISSASRKTGLDVSSICAQCSQKSGSRRKYVFRYK